MKKALFLLLFTVISLGLFAQELVYTPTLKAPANNAIDQMPNVILSWNAVTGSLNLQYHFQVDTSMNFNSPLMQEQTLTLTTGYQLNSLLFNTVYYWRVRAIDGATSGWSEVWNFKVFNLVTPSKPTLNKTGEEPNATIEWKSSAGQTPITGITNFDYQVDTTNAFNSPLLVSGSTNGTTYSHVNSNLRFDTRYFWRVRARHASGTTDWQPVWQNRQINSGVMLFDAWFVNDTKGFLVGENGTFLATSDGGITWENLPTGTTNDLYGVCFIDASKGYVVGESGLIMKTTDAGATWTTLVSGTTNDLLSLYFSADKKGYVVGDQGTILKTTNDTEWSAQNSGTNVPLSAVTFPSATLGFVVGNDGTILKNENNSNDWTTEVSGTNNDLYTLSFPSEDFGVVAGDEGTVLRYTSTGWTAIPGFPAAIIASVDFPNETTGYLCGEDGLFFKTYNAGLTWSSIDLETTADLFAVIFSSDLSGYAIGNDDFISKTTTGGMPWSFTTMIKPELSSPANNAVDQVLNVILKWKAVGGSLAYEYQISADPGFEVLILNAETNTTEANAEFLLFGMDYYWRVRARHLADTSGWSDARKFTSINTVLLKSPSNDQMNVSVTPTMMWYAQTAITEYQLQIATDINFTNIFWDVKPAGTESDIKVTKKMASSTSYYWRMRTFSDGGSLADTTDWSAPWRFTTGFPQGIENQETLSFSIYPNPVSDVVFLKIAPREATEASVTMIDLLGKPVLQQLLTLKAGENVSKVTLEGISKGIYIIRVTINGQTYNQKLIVE